MYAYLLILGEENRDPLGFRREEDEKWELRRKEAMKRGRSRGFQEYKTDKQQNTPLDDLVHISRDRLYFPNAAPDPR